MIFMGCKCGNSDSDSGVFEVSSGSSDKFYEPDSNPKHRNYKRSFCDCDCIDVPIPLEEEEISGVCVGN